MFLHFSQGQKMIKFLFDMFQLINISQLYFYDMYLHCSESLGLHILSVWSISTTVFTIFLCIHWFKWFQPFCYRHNVCAKFITYSLLSCFGMTVTSFALVIWWILNLFGWMDNFFYLSLFVFFIVFILVLSKENYFLTSNFTKINLFNF